MNPWVVAEAIWSTFTAPMLCRVKGHQWHVWRLHSCPIKVCIRCGDMH